MELLCLPVLYWCLLRQDRKLENLGIYLELEANEGTNERQRASLQLKLTIVSQLARKLRASLGRSGYSFSFFKYRQED